jgi:hypothetical protein
LSAKFLESCPSIGSDRYHFPEPDF